jgi:hypothetical protein
MAREPNETARRIDPGVAFMLEPVFDALDRARAATEQLGRELTAKLQVGDVPLPSAREPHPDDQAWLISEQARLASLADRELANLLATLEERLGADVVDALIGGATLADLGIDANPDLERLVERLRGYAGER